MKMIQNERANQIKAGNIEMPAAGGISSSPKRDFGLSNKTSI